MNTSKNDEEILPDGWILCQSKSNRDRKYYFNKKNGKSSWTKPKAEESPAKVDMKSKKVTSAQVPKSSGSDRKCLKRKSDGLNEASAPKIRPRSESSPLATPKIIKKLPQATTTAIKNSASKRLALLQKQLSDDIKKVDKSCDKNKKTSPTNPVKPPQKCSPKKPETQSKISRLGDLRSPNYVDSKCPITSQTPSSDSIHSIPSPCQFFAANKILSSMKAQLPEYRCNRTKPKDMFADIEEQICSQTPEYPSTKHPATPPQFSEASKIVSAINSKLAYKSGDPKDITLYTTAKERMESLRKSLTAEAEVESTEVTMKDISFVNTHEVKDNNSFVNEQVHSKEQQGLKRQMSKEAMEVEECKELRPSSPKVQCNRPAAVEKSNSEDLVLVVDTNIFIHELHVIKNVLNSHIKGYKNQPTLLVPWRVINELDRLKDNNNGNGAICKRARAAMDYLYESLPENNRIKGQPLRDANSHIYPCECPDDEILNCSLQQAERGKSVILLSNDKNLCNKASINNIKSIGLRELKAQLETQPAECADPDLQVSMKHYETCIYQLLSNILENEMRAKYDSLWQHVLFKAPPWSLRDVLQCLLKHWIAVFNEVFPRIEHIITDLNNTLHTIVNLGPKSLTQEKVNNFKELSLEVARKCQIIPEYMELAKMTVEQISRAADDRESDMKVVQAFETVWTVHSSYCAKLATGLEINHNIDDKINGTEPLEELTNKWNDFSNAIYNFTDAIKGILSVSSESSLMMEGQMGRLESSFRESLTLMAVDHSVVNRENLRVFCTKCRNMLQEAYTKFAQLTELLDECRNVMKK